MKKIRTIRIPIIGDSQVGKTTFISMIISQSVDAAEKVLRPVLLPTNMCVIAPNVFTELVDTGEETDYETEIQHADLVIIMYDMTNELTINNLHNKWLPMVKDYNERIPIIIIGNKMDKDELKDTIGTQVIRDVLKLALKKFKQVEMGMECSAYYNLNINQILNACHQSVIYPLKPLYNITNKTITENLKRALTRIFRILDRDYDGILSDKEMSQLQESVFGSQLDNYDLDRIRELIKVELENYDLREINLDGFIALHKRCIESLNIQICWGILRAFGYDDKLHIRHLENNLIFNEDEGISIELSAEPIMFLTQLFNYYNNINSESVVVNILEEIFYPMGCIPFQQMRGKEEIDISDFLLAWHYRAYIDYLECYETLRNIGYNRSLDDSFVVTNSKASWKKMKKTRQRNVISIGIIENEKYSNYIDSLFPVENLLSLNKVPSSYSLFTSSDTSKVMLVFKLNENNYAEISFNPKYRKMLDILLYFQQDVQKIRPIINSFSQTIIKKEIRKENLQKDLEIGKLSQLDLSQVPIGYKKSNTNKFFEFAWTTLKNVEGELDPNVIEELQHCDKGKFNFLIPVMVVGLSALAGVLAFKTYNKK